MKAWRGLAAFKGESSLATWLHRIAYHPYTHHLRSRREHAALDGTTGAKKWELAGDGVFESSPAIGADRTMYVGCKSGKVYAIR